MGALHGKELTPAYGRDYRSAKEAKADFEAGKDFVLNDVMSKWNGKYCSIRDCERGDTVILRYRKKTKITTFKVI